MAEKLLDFVGLTKIAVEKLHIKLSERPEDYAYKMGYDCEMNGANLTNCHFTIFTSGQNMRAWELGRQHAAKDKKGGD